MNNFQVLILGADMNAYYMARCHHEKFGTNATVIGKRRFGPTKFTSIIDFIAEPQLENPDVFVKTLNSFAEQSTVEKIVLIGTNDTLVSLITKNKELLHPKFTFNYPSHELVTTLLRKDLFYTKFSNELPIPKTEIYSCSNPRTIRPDEFTFPLIVKAADGIMYHEHEFSGMKKVYKIASFEELQETIQKISSAGYTSNLIIQEFIPGDDSALFDAVFYVGTDKKVKLMTFAQIGLQERTPTGVGNCTVLVNGYSEHGYDETLVRSLGSFLEKINYQGFAEFDLKYDSRSNSYKVLEINPRQARSSYYLAACGFNLVEYLVKDVIYKESFPTTLIKKNLVLSFVPFSVIKKHVTSTPLLNEIIRLKKEGSYVRPLHYSKDRSLQRKIFLFLKDLNYIQKYKKLVW
jgi:D-aspartate ligase